MKKLAVVNLNLLPKDPFLETTLGRLLQWALGVGRYLVIFTEMVVIFSFFGRFTLDRQITDLNGKIFQKQTIIESYGDMEDKIRQVQKKTESYLQVEQQENIVEVFPALTEILPPDVHLKELTMQPDRVTLDGVANSNTSLSLLINNIQLSTKFTDVSVEKIGTSQGKNQGFDFIIKASTKRAAPPTSASTKVPLTSTPK